MQLLSSMIFLPMIGGLFLLLFDKSISNNIAKGIALVFSAICLFFSCKMYFLFDLNIAKMQFLEKELLFPFLNVYYSLGVDGFSVALIILTNIITTLVIISSIYSVKNNVAKYLALFLIMQGIICGIFSSLDAILFYIFLEAMLIPMFLIIGIFGGERRIYAAIKFFLYTFLGSVFLLIAILYLNFYAKKLGYASEELFNITTFSKLNLDLVTQKWLFLCLLIAFAVKLPMLPIHTWLPDAHLEAPTAGSVVLAAIALKVGAYGFLRFILPITTKACVSFTPLMIILSLIAIVYISLVALYQKNLKKLIAYSSISHMGFVTLGFFVIFAIIIKKLDLDSILLGIEGAFVQVISHGFISAALFFAVGVLIDRINSKNISDYGGIVNKMPLFSVFFLIFALANIGFPGTSGFIGEFFVILASFQANFWFAFCGALIVIFSASYTLFMYKRVIFGGLKNKTLENIEDLYFFEKLIFFILTAFIILIGLYPALLLNLIDLSAKNLFNQIIFNLGISG